jgi:Holliday junction resolvase RusA-like endonuclease
MAWRTAIAFEAAQAMEGRPVMEGPLVVTARFYLPRPRTAPARIVVPATRPDIDKLARALLDGLTGVVFRDDSQVVTLDAGKRFDVEYDRIPGVWVYVRDFDPSEPAP